MTIGVLIFGAAGQVGKDVLSAATAAGVDAIGHDRASVDIRDANAVHRAIADAGNRVVINAAAYTAVDLAESEPDVAFAVNRDGPAVLAEACGTAGLPLIHLSTDYVFDGRKNGAYVESDPVAPLGVYGRSKAEGETAIRERHDRHLIVRTSWVFGVHGRNFVKTMMRLALERDRLRVVADQHGCPTAADDIARAILDIARRIAARQPVDWGTYHFASRGSTTWHGLARRVIDRQADRVGRRPDVEAIGTAEFPMAAVRPANSVLDCRLLTERMGIRGPFWQDSVDRIVDELLDEAAVATRGKHR